MDCNRRGDSQPVDAGLRAPRLGRPCHQRAALSARPYRVQQGDVVARHPVLRDHALSDMIGFHYQRSPGRGRRPDDFLPSTCTTSGRAPVDPSQPALVSVILDGENCWEHYPEGGVPFCGPSTIKLHEERRQLRPVKIGDAIPARASAAGSSAEPDVRGELDPPQLRDLDRPRRRTTPRLGRTPSDARASGASAHRGGTVPARASSCRAAWEEIFIAEGATGSGGSGDDHSSRRQDALFDSLFRRHLQNVYLLLGDTPPLEPEPADASRSGSEVAVHGAEPVPRRCGSTAGPTSSSGSVRGTTGMSERSRHDGDGWNDADHPRSVLHGFSLTDLDFPRRLRSPGPRGARRLRRGPHRLRGAGGAGPAHSPRGPAGAELGVAARRRPAIGRRREGPAASARRSHPRGLDPARRCSASSVGEPVRFYVELRESRAEPGSGAARDGEIQTLQRPSFGRSRRRCGTLEPRAR